jgi:hypothetical protein
MVRDTLAQITQPDCFTAYVEFCNQHGWTALAKNKFGSLIGDAVVHQFGLTPSHDIPDASGKLQRGWRGLKLNQATNEMASEVSDCHCPDGSDTFSQVRHKETSITEPALDPAREEAMLL